MANPAHRPPQDFAAGRGSTITPAGRAKQAEAKRYWKKAQLDLNTLLGPAQVTRLHGLIDDGLARLDRHAGTP